jgi:2-polyprenyl-3-methyl-5-hydroxy-6-metoxy-1,4-benzoquinol methylase
VPTPQPNSSPGNLLERANFGLHDAIEARVVSAFSREARILDVGCGTGAWLSRLAQRGFFNLSGVDLNVDQSRSSGLRVDCVNLDAPNWPAVAGGFDLITCIEVFEHIENPGQFLGNLENLLAPGGELLLTSPNVESLASRLRFLATGSLKQFDHLGDATHITPLFSYTFPKLLARKGLRIAERWSFPEGHRTLTSRSWVNWVTAALRIVISEPVGGDNVCMRIVRV